MPRSNTTQTETPARSRSRGPARASTPQRSASNDAVSAPSNPSYDEIAEAAYHRYLKRGGGDGQDFDDWLEAERELKARRSS